MNAVQDENDREDLQEGTSKEKMVCFLWQNWRCLYGDDCTFAHTGEGALLENKSTSTSRKRKCWVFLKGKQCKLGDNCPFLHTAIPKAVKVDDRPKSHSFSTKLV